MKQTSYLMKQNELNWPRSALVVDNLSGFILQTERAEERKEKTINDFFSPHFFIIYCLLIAAVRCTQHPYVITIEKKYIIIVLFALTKKLFNKLGNNASTYT